MRSGLIIRYSLIVLMSVLLMACNKGEEKKDEKEKQTAVPVEVAEVGQATVSASYSGTANLEADKRAEVVAEVTGVLESIHAEEGDVVEKGQILARLEQDKPQLELNRALADLERIDAELKRAKKLHERKMKSSEEYDRLRFDLRAQNASVELAKLNLAHTSIRAPISGVISQREARVGNLISNGEKVFSVLDLNSLQAELFVPEKELAVLKPGLPVDITVDAWPGRVFKAKLKRISPIIDSGSGTFAITIEIPADPALKAGMFVRASVTYDPHPDAIVVDRSAVIMEDGESSVFVVKEDMTVEKRMVETGYLSGSRIEILTGLKVGETVVTTGKNSLKNEALIEIVSAE